jgi:hypothetical protein
MPAELAEGNRYQEMGKLTREALRLSPLITRHSSTNALG